MQFWWGFIFFCYKPFETKPLMTSGNMSVKNMILGGTAGAGLCVASPSLAGAMLGVGSLGPISGGTAITVCCTHALGYHGRQ